jgi:hypothetical protein
VRVAQIGSRLLAWARRCPPRDDRDETIRMEATSFGYFPRVFVWQGQRYDVHRVEECWTRSSGRGRDTEQHCFRVCCLEGTFELHHDLGRDTWHVARLEQSRYALG